MTDDELTYACARKFFHGRVSDLRNYNLIDGKLYVEPDNETGHIIYDPLHDDVQAFALVKKFGLELMRNRRDLYWRARFYTSKTESVEAGHGDLSRAICECVAKLPD